LICFLIFFSFRWLIDWSMSLYRNATPPVPWIPKSGRGHSALCLRYRPLTANCLSKSAPERTTGAYLITDWTLDLRNMLVHRGRRIEMGSI